MKLHFTVKSDRQRSTKVNTLALLVIFIWFFMGQVAVVHSAKHSLDFDNNCVTCVAQNNFGSATLNSDLSITISQTSQWLNVEYQGTFVLLHNYFFSSRDPPLISF